MKLAFFILLNCFVSMNAHATVVTAADNKKFALYRNEYEDSAAKYNGEVVQRLSELNLNPVSGSRVTAREVFDYWQTTIYTDHVLRMRSGPNCILHLEPLLRSEGVSISCGKNAKLEHHTVAEIQKSLDKEAANERREAAKAREEERKALAWERSHPEKKSSSSETTTTYYYGGSSDGGAATYVAPGGSSTCWQSVCYCSAGGAQVAYGQNCP